MVRTRVWFAVVVSAVVLLAGVGPVVGVNGAYDRAISENPASTAIPGAGADAVERTDTDPAQYQVSLDNVTVRTWLLRDSTVRNATVQQVVVENVTSEDGARENVTLENVTVGRFEIDRGRLLNVTATKLIVRNRSVLDVPGGDLFDPDVENRTIDREWTRNATVSGVVIDQLTVDAAFVCENTSLGTEAADGDAYDPRTDDEDPAITVRNGSVGEALIIRGAATNWSVGSVDEPEAQNASLPQGCQRGQGDGEQGDGTEQGDGQDEGDEGDGQGDGGDGQDGDGDGQDGGDGQEGDGQDGGDGDAGDGDQGDGGNQSDGADGNESGGGDGQDGGQGDGQDGDGGNQSGDGDGQNGGGGG